MTFAVKSTTAPRAALLRALLTLLSLYIFANLYAVGAAMYCGHFCGGDFDGFSFDPWGLTLNAVLIIATYSFFYLYSRRQILTFKPYRSAAESKGRETGWIVFLLQAVFLSFFIFGGQSAQRLEEEGPSYVTYYQALFVPDFLFLAAYPLIRKTKLYTPNLVVFLASTLYRGMLGGAAGALFFELGYVFLQRRWKLLLLLLFTVVMAAPFMYGFRIIIRSSSVEYLASAPIIEILGNLLASLGSLQDYLLKFGEAVHFVFMRLQHVSSASAISENLDSYLLGAYDGKFSYFFTDGRIQSKLFGWINPDATRLSEYVMLQNFSAEFGTWDVQIGWVGWLWAEPLLFPLYMAYNLLLFTCGLALYRRMRTDEFGVYCLSVIFLLFMLHGWFAAFSNYLQALFLVVLFVSASRSLPFIAALLKAPPLPLKSRGQLE